VGEHPRVLLTADYAEEEDDAEESFGRTASLGMKGHLRSAKLAAMHEAAQPQSAGRCKVAGRGCLLDTSGLGSTIEREAEVEDTTVMDLTFEPREYFAPSFIGGLLPAQMIKPKVGRLEGDANAVWRNHEGHPLAFSCTSASAPCLGFPLGGGQDRSGGEAMAPNGARSQAAVVRMPMLQRSVPKNEAVASSGGECSSKVLDEERVAVRLQVGGGFSVKGGARDNGATETLLEWRWPLQMGVPEAKTTQASGVSNRRGSRADATTLQGEGDNKRPHSSSAAVRPSKAPQRGLPRPSTAASTSSSERKGGEPSREKGAASATRGPGGGRCSHGSASSEAGSLVRQRTSLVPVP